MTVLDMNDSELGSVANRVYVPTNGIPVDDLGTAMWREAVLASRRRRYAIYNCLPQPCYQTFATWYRTLLSFRWSLMHETKRDPSKVCSVMGRIWNVHKGASLSKRGDIRLQIILKSGNSSQQWCCYFVFDSRIQKSITTTFFLERTSFFLLLFLAESRSVQCSTRDVSKVSWWMGSLTVID